MALGQANKGEWSEVYAALRLLSDGRIALADTEGSSGGNCWMDVAEVVRKEGKERTVAYRVEANSVVVDVNGKEAKRIPLAKFTDAADKLMAEIRLGRRAFRPSDELVSFLESAEVLSAKAGSGDKNDIYLTTIDGRTGSRRQEVGFSVKSHFGSDPTLFNTAPASAVVYELIGMSDAEMTKVNSLVDSAGHVATKERCEALGSSGVSVVYSDFAIAKRAKLPAFKENLELLNPLLPDAIEWILQDHFFRGEKAVAVPDVVDKLIQANPKGITRPEVKYPYMFKLFLYAAYCKMTASTLWDGVGVVNGGYIDVSDHGGLSCHYALESEGFKRFLYEAAYLDFPDTGPKHGDYAKVYKQDGKYYFNLNFQIRLR